MRRRAWRQNTSADAQRLLAPRARRGPRASAPGSPRPRSRRPRSRCRPGGTGRPACSAAAPGRRACRGSSRARAGARLRSTKRRCVASGPNRRSAARSPSRGSASGTTRRRSASIRGSAASFCAERLVGIDERAGDLEVAVDHLARHEQVHDLGRALEDLVDPVVAHDALDRHRRLAARRERLLGLVAAPAADLHRLVDHLPGARGVPLLGGRGLEPDVVAAAIGHLGRQARRATPSRTRVAAMSAILCAIASWRPTGLPHCTRSLGPAAHDPEAGLDGADRDVGDREPAVVERGERDLEALALLADQVRGGHAHVA